MRLFENGEMKREALMVSVILLAFLSACGRQAGEVSSAPVSEGAESGTAAIEPAAETEPEGEPGLEQMDDGKLRILYRYEENDSVVFHGAKIVFRGKNPVNSFELEDGRVVFSAMEQDGETKRYSLYDADGTRLIDGLPASPNTVIGHWLFCTPDWYEKQEDCVIDLRTMEHTSFPSSSTPFQIDETYFGLPIYDSRDEVRIYRVSDLSEVETFSGCWGYVEDGLPGFISLHSYNDHTGENTSELYSPATGQKYENFSYSCGEGLAVLQDAEGLYSVVDVATGEILYPKEGEGTNAYQYYSDTVKVWQNAEETYIDAPCYPEPQLIQYANVSWMENDPYIDVVRLNRSHDVLNRDGEKVLAAAPSEGKEIYSMGYGYLFEVGTDWQEKGVILHRVDGRSISLDRYNSVYWFQNMEGLIAASYTVGNTYLVDLLDTDGNIVLEGVNEYYSYTSDPAGVIFVRRGFSYGVIDMEGNWLWKESVFQSTRDETGVYY